MEFGLGRGVKAEEFALKRMAMMDRRDGKKAEIFSDCLLSCYPCFFRIYAPANSHSSF